MILVDGFCYVRCLHLLGKRFFLCFLCLYRSYLRIEIGSKTIYQKIRIFSCIDPVDDQSLRLVHQVLIWLVWYLFRIQLPFVMCFALILLGFIHLVVLRLFVFLLLVFFLAGRFWILVFLFCRWRIFLVCLGRWENNPFIHDLSFLSLVLLYLYCTLKIL